MSMQKKLWSINALSSELNMDRRTLSKKLDNLEPAKKKKLSNRTEKQWYLNDVIEHLNRPKTKQNGNGKIYYRMSDDDLLEWTESTCKEFIASEYIPKTVENETFINILVNGTAQDLNISPAQALTAYKYATLALIYATCDGYQDDDMKFKFREDNMLQKLGDLGNEAFYNEYFLQPK